MHTRYIFLHCMKKKSAHRRFLLFYPRVFSRALGCGARSRPACTLRCKCGPWPRSMERALGVQSRENWQVTTGRHSEHLEPSRRMQTHIVNKCPDRFRICRSADGSHSLPDHLVLVLECSCLIACRSADGSH